jgi:hypothetical protein
MKAEKILETIKERRLSTLRRNLSMLQAMVISLIVTIFISFFESIKDVIDGNKVGVGFIVFIFFVSLLLILLGIAFSKTVLLVELKEEGVHKWKRKKALKYIDDYVNELKTTL